MTPLKLFTNEIKDQYLQENFIRLEDFFREDPLQKFGFKFQEITFTAAVTARAVRHFLMFTPKDIIQLSVTRPDSVTVTWHYDDFNETNLYVTTSGACTIRILVGRYEEF